MLIMLVHATFYICITILADRSYLPKKKKVRNGNVLDFLIMLLDLNNCKMI